MKTIGLIAVMLCGCAANRQGYVEPETATNTFVFADESLPPTNSDIEMTVRDHSPTVVRPTIVVDEQRQFSNSLHNIHGTYLSEMAAIAQCGRWSPWAHVNSCALVVKDICKVDEMIDSRGGIHKKPYCSPAWNMRLK